MSWFKDPTGNGTALQGMLKYHHKYFPLTFMSVVTDASPARRGRYACSITSNPGLAQHHGELLIDQS
jgi:hypothetical protein